MAFEFEYDYKVGNSYISNRNLLKTHILYKVRYVYILESWMRKIIILSRKRTKFVALFSEIYILIELFFKNSTISNDFWRFQIILIHFYEF